MICVLNLIQGPCYCGFSWQKTWLSLLSSCTPLMSYTLYYSPRDYLSFSTCNTFAYSIFSACPIPFQSTHLPESYFPCFTPHPPSFDISNVLPGISAFLLCAHVLCSPASCSNIPLAKIPQLVSLLTKILDVGNRDTVFSSLYPLCHCTWYKQSKDPVAR